MASTGGSPGAPNMGKYRISRRGRKLMISDDQRTLMALPKDVPERIWAEVLQKEETDMICLDIREDILEEALRECYEHYMEKQTALFTVHCAAQAWMKLIDWHFYRHDPGEEPSAAPLCYIPNRAESWVPDKMAEPSPKDTWCRQELKVLAECVTDETPPPSPSNDSVEIPVLKDIPEEYWFPGKVNIYYDKAGNICTYEQHLREQQLAAAAKQNVEPSPPYDDEDSTGTQSTENIGAESEIETKVTDYSDLAMKDSTTGVRHGTPVDGSLHGAGDSTVAMKRTQRRNSCKGTCKGAKSKSFSRRISSLKTKNQLPPLEVDSGSVFSIISDCRLRNLRLETQLDVSPEIVESLSALEDRRKKAPNNGF